MIKIHIFYVKNIIIIVTTKYIGDQQEQAKETCFPFIDHYDQNNNPNHPINLPPLPPPPHHHHQYYYRAVYFPLISVLIQKV